MERELFDWVEWDGEPECMVFQLVVLKVPIGIYPVGTKFASASISHYPKEGKGILRFYQKDKEEPVARFCLHYRVGEQIS